MVCLIAPFLSVRHFGHESLRMRNSVNSPCVPLSVFSFILSSFTTPIDKPFSSLGKKEDSIENCLEEKLFHLQKDAT